MAKQRVVNVKFWDDTYVMKLDPTEKLLFLYFLTNPLTNISGVYEISLRRISFDTGIDSDMVLNIFKRLENDKKIVYRDGWVYIINFIKNQVNSPSVAEGILREVLAVPLPILEQFDIASPHLDTGCGRVWRGWGQGGGTVEGEGVLNLTKLNLTKLNAFADSFLKEKKERGEKRTYRGQEMRQKNGKWFVIPKEGGEWLEFDMRAWKDTEVVK